MHNAEVKAQPNQVTGVNVNSRRLYEGDYVELYPSCSSFLQTQAAIKYSLLI